LNRAAVDWERDVALQNAGYLVRRVSEPELSAEPATVANSIFEVLKREVDRLLSEAEEAQNRKGSRLISP
jgi:very-short-patch-repair endonuclease